MNREEINIYIETTVKGPREQMGAYLYIVEWIKEQGEPETEGGFCFQMGTENRMVLGALLRALGRIEEPSSIRVFTRCGHVLHSIQNHRPVQWHKNGWKNAKGKPVHNAEIWEKVLQAMEPHTYTITDQDHSYREWMQFELENRIKEKRKNAVQRKD